MARRVVTVRGLVALVVSVAAATSIAACSAPGSSPSSGGSSSGSSGGASSGTASSSGTTSSGSSSGGVGATGPTSLPFTVSEQFIPSGFMGDSPTDFNAVKMSPDATKCPNRDAAAKGSCYSIDWTPTFLTGAKSAWVGVYWQYPANNWGAKEGKAIPAGATKVSFSAMSPTDGLEVTFLAGGVNASGDPTLKYADTFSATQAVTLTTSWAHYEVSLTGDTYSDVIGAFAWSITTTTTTPVTFYVDDITWE